MKYKKDMILETKDKRKFKILEYKNFKEIKIIFLNTNNIKIVSSSNINSKTIKDELEKKLLNIGYIGLGKYNSKINENIYNCWSNMLKRCYDKKNKKFKSYGAKGVTVCSAWHNFQNFAEWYERNYIEGFELDKDILCSELKIFPKIYSPKTCKFISKKENLELSMRKIKIKAINVITKEEFVFESISDCSKKLKLQTSNINKVLKKEKKNTKKFIFTIEEKICQTESELTD